MSNRDGSWPTGPQGKGPLAGVRVLDFSRILAGPYATMHLADLGADVIKVESPQRGDETRHWGPPFGPDGSAAYFHAVNHNKRSVALDLADSDDASFAQDLAASADIVVDNFLPGRMQKFGLGRESLKARNPQVITATISGFGSGNAYSGRPGFDFLAQAMGGLMSITGQHDGEPTRVGVAITDLMAGVLLCSGVLAALVETKSGGNGRHVEVSLLDTQTSMLANIASGWLVGGTVPDRFGNQHPNIAPYETLATQDGPIAVAVGTDRQFQRLATELGRPELGDDARFRANRDRIAHRAELVEELEELLGAAARDNWLDRLIPAGVPVAPVNTVPEALNDAVVKERMIVEVNGVRQVRTAIALDGELPEIHSPPPLLGQHTEQIKNLVWGYRPEAAEGLNNTRRVSNE
ncbi:MAG: CaiB/BaiF CoA transferase family protein [Leucobacter sp.]